MNQTCEKANKTNFGSHFGSFGPHLVPTYFFVNFTTTGSWTLFQAFILLNLKEN